MNRRKLVCDDLWPQVLSITTTPVPLAGARSCCPPSLRCRPHIFHRRWIRGYTHNCVKFSGHEPRALKPQKRSHSFGPAPKTWTQVSRSSFADVGKYEPKRDSDVHGDKAQECEPWAHQTPEKSHVGRVVSKPDIPFAHGTPELYEKLRREVASGEAKSVATQVLRLIRSINEPPDSKLYSLLLFTNIERENGSAAEVAKLLQEMTEEGLQLDSTVQHDALKVLAVHPDTLLRGQILEDMRNRWQNLSADGWHDVAAGLLREGQLELALEILDDMRRAQVDIRVWLYDMALYMLCESVELDEALALMKHRVEHSKSTVDGAAWFHLFDVACERSHLETIRFIWERRVEALYLNPTTGQCMQALNAAASSGDVALANRIFDRLRRRDTAFKSIHYEMLMKAYEYNSDLQGILSVSRAMHEARIPLQPRALEQLSNCLADSPARPTLAFRLLEKRPDDGKVATPTLNCLIEASIAHGNLEEAIDMYKQLHRICADGANVETFNAIFRGCRKKGGKETAMFFAAEMMALKIQPNALTYDRLLMVCLLERDYDDALRYYAEMRESGFLPRAGTWLTMIQKLGEEGDDRACDLLAAMKDLGLDTKLAASYLRTTLRDKGNSAGVTQPGCG